MALVIADRVQETTTTTGTGTVTLGGASAGYQSFAVIGNGNTTYYTITASSGNWEVGVGTYTSSGTTLSRDTVLSSSNSGALVNFGAGSKSVFVTYPSFIASITPQQIFDQCRQTVSQNYTLPTDFNASATGPLTVASAVTVTISNNSRLVIL